VQNYNILIFLALVVFLCRWRVGGRFNEYGSRQDV